MRRRIRSAALPIRRQSLPQVVVDGGLVALAYLLAFLLRFDGLPSGHDKDGRYTKLLGHTIWWVVPLTLIVLVGFGVYQRLWKYIGRRDFEAIAKGVVVSTLLVVGVIALFHPVTSSGGPSSQRRGRAAVDRGCRLPAHEPGTARRRPFRHARDQ